MSGISMAQATLASNQTRYGLVYVFPALETEGEKQQSAVYLIVGSVIIVIVLIMIFLYFWFRGRNPTAPMAPMAQIRPAGATITK